MEDPSSATDPEATVIASGSKTNAPPKRPLAKTAPSRPSTTLTRPTSTSAAKSSTASSLTKPPTRPAVASSIRKTPSTTAAGAPASSHRKRASISSGDERNSTGLAARPKRMSLAASTSNSSMKPPSSTAVRMSMAGASPSTDARPTGRTSTLSPTRTTKAPITPASRSGLASSSRSKPQSSINSSLRNPGTIEARKRLSTIPASPATKTEPAEDDKENLLETIAEAKEKPKRPILGKRQSTRSNMIEQRLREFELVNQMLRAAMAEEGDNEGQQIVEDEAATTLASLKTSLAQAKKSEGEAGPAGDNAIDGGMEDPGVKHDEPQGTEITELRAKLEESQRLIQELRGHNDELKNKLAEFGEVAQQQSDALQKATDARREDHFRQLEALKTSHNSELSAVQETITSLKSKVSEQDEQIAIWQTRHREAKDALAAAEQSKADELEALRQIHIADLSEVESKIDQASRASSGAVSEHAKELEELRQSYASELARLRAMLDETTEASAKATEEHAVEVKNLSAVINNLQSEVQARLDAHANEAEARLSKLRESHQQELSAAVEEAEKTKDQEIAERQRQIDDLNEMMVTIRDDKQTQQSTHQSELEARIEKLREEHEATLEAAVERAKKDSLAAQSKETEGLREIINKLQDEIIETHHKSSDEAETRVQQLREEHEAALARAVEAAKSETLTQHSSEIEHLRKVVSALQDEILHTNEIRSDEADARLKQLQVEHEKALSEALESARNTSTRDLDALREGHASALKNKVEELEATHSETLKQLREDLESSQKSLQEQTRVLEAQLRSAQGDLQAARMQSATLKDILSSIENENKEKDEEHATALEKLEKEIQTSVTKMAQQSSRMMTMEQELEQARASSSIATNEREAALSELRDQFEAAKSESAALRDELAEVQKKHDELNQDLKAAVARHDADTEQLKSQHDEAINSLNESHGQKIKDLKSEHEEALRASQMNGDAQREEVERLKLQHYDAIKSLEESHRQALNALKANHTEAQEQLQTSSSTQYDEIKQLMSQNEAALVQAQEKVLGHEREIANMQSDHAEALRYAEATALSYEADLKKLQAEHAEALTKHQADSASHQIQIQEIQSQHERNLMEARVDAKSYQEELDSIREQHTATTEDLKKQVEEYAANLEKVKKEHAASLEAAGKVYESKLAELEAEHQAAMQDHPAQGESAAQSMIDDNNITELHAQISDLKSSGDATASVVQELKARSRVLQDEIGALKQQHELELAEIQGQLDGALLEVETQRGIGEEAKAKLAEAEAMLATTKKSRSRSRSIRKSPERRARKSLDIALTQPGVAGLGSSNASNGLNLSHSKWASAEDTSDTLLQPDPQTESHKKSLGSKKSSMEGRLAGFQAQLKELDHLNDEFLEEHQKMAKILTGVNGGQEERAATEAPAYESESR